LRRCSSSNIIFRKWVTGISFLCDPHYVSYRKTPGSPTRSVRRTSGLVLVANSELSEHLAVPFDCRGSSGWEQVRNDWTCGRQYEPYEKTRKEATQDRASYIAQIRRLMGTRRCVASSFAPADEHLANALFKRGVPIEQVERGFLLGCARKYATMLNSKSNAVIVSFSYFQNVIEEAGELKMSEDYWRYLRMRIDKMEQQWLDQSQDTGEAKFNNRRMAPMSGRI
jgi:hypothetical protein